uniref:Uncharacterized protein n=1 Tax=Siphoviridae sp. ctKNZ79 TaxID=2825440 RepID=A0A8S5U9L1_9CAUD|nr:MAG TPA: hypothetical protein [Siphoviridae sp. ctKNZ79]
METFLSRRRNRSRGAAEGGEKVFCFFDPDETEDLAGGSRNHENLQKRAKIGGRNGAG